MRRALTRRSMLKASATSVVSLPFVLNARAQAAPTATIGDIKIISSQPDKYHGWPTVARRSNGQLLVTCSGGREAHVCPFGRVELITSDDDGKSWSGPRVLMETQIDDRDSGVLETAKGSILVTTFTSLAYVPTLKKAQTAEPGSKGAWPKPKLDRWLAVHNQLGEAERQAMLGVWMLRSTDGGKTFGKPYRCLVNSPHGPIQLADGRVLYLGRNLWQGEPWIGACQSTDDGQSWSRLAAIPARDGDSLDGYHELHAVEAADGRILAQIRNHNKAGSGETLQSESADGGKTWSAPRSIGVWGLPSHMLRLADNRLLMTYGHRRAPFGNQARVSTDNGRTWSEPVIISGDGTGGDLGYPSTVELADGSLLTVWYENMNGSGKAVLRQATWTLKS
ncbi:MAG: sialidase family protein [Thermoguttaceae bacterium]